MKKKSTVIILSVVAAVLIIGIALTGSVIGSYNGLVEMSESVETASSNISTQLQRRNDLIPNLVEVVKGYSEHELETFKAVTEARNALNGADNLGEQAEASSRLSGALDIWVNAVTEAYPELKANTQFIALQDQLEGTENRIATARKDYNDSAKKYNTNIRKFPKNILASIFGFEKVEYFEAQEGAEKAPSVEF